MTAAETAWEETPEWLFDGVVGCREGCGYGVRLAPHLRWPAPAWSLEKAKGSWTSGRARPGRLPRAGLLGDRVRVRGRPDDSAQELQATGSGPRRQDGRVLYGCPPALP